jgi:hypothetical protein
VTFDDVHDLESALAYLREQRRVSREELHVLVMVVVHQERRAIGEVGDAVDAVIAEMGIELYGPEGE